MANWLELLESQCPESRGSWGIEILMSTRLIKINTENKMPAKAAARGEDSLSLDFDISSFITRSCSYSPSHNKIHLAKRLTEFITGVWVAGRWYTIYPECPTLRGVH